MNRRVTNSRLILNNNEPKVNKIYIPPTRDKSLAIVAFMHNIKELRGLDRLRYMFRSLRHNTVEPIVLYDSSNDDSFDEVAAICSEFGIIRLYNPIKNGDNWNKPFGLNCAIDYAIDQFNPSYIMATDIDYIFAPDFISKAKSSMSYKKFIIQRCHYLTRNQTKNLSNVNFLCDRDFHNLVKNANFGSITAVGACQLAAAAWFKAVDGYNDNFELWSCMDTEMVDRARSTGLNVFWLDSAILHQHHETIKYAPQANKQRKINQAIYRNLRKSNGQSRSNPLCE